MIKLLIADDEPLVQIGLRTMINWEELGIEICGAASNGDAAFARIQEQRPEIVITDIQMPCSSGLELGRRCREELGELPVFLILTNFEDFGYAKEAISFQAVDYLVKIDLSPESLTAAVKRALERVKSLQKAISKDREPAEAVSIEAELERFRERFCIRLLNNLFDSRAQFARQAEEFHLNFDAAGYAAASIEFTVLKQSAAFPRGSVLAPSLASGVPNGYTSPAAHFAADGTNAAQHEAASVPAAPDANFSIYQQLLPMFRKLSSRYINCRAIALDMQCLAVIISFDETQTQNWMSLLRTSIQDTLSMLKNYYSVSCRTCIGRLVRDPLELSVSWYDAKQLTQMPSAKEPILFWENTPNAGKLRNVFNLSLFRSDIGRAFEELDEQALRDVFDNIISLLSADCTHYAQALDAAAGILHLSVNLLSGGQEIVSEIFAGEPDTYCSLYRMTTVDGVVSWLKRLEDGLCRAFSSDRGRQRNYLVDHCCTYITEHIHERIILQDIADVFGVSPNYLSQLFKKHMDIGLNEYITTRKINESKRLLKETNLKIYEISDQLGFESAFYFSKVFKKYTDLSPKDYRNLSAGTLPG